MTMHTLFICANMWLVAALTVQNLSGNFRSTNLDVRMFFASLMYGVLAIVLKVIQ